MLQEISHLITVNIFRFGISFESQNYFSVRNLNQNTAAVNLFNNYPWDMGIFPTPW